MFSTLWKKGGRDVWLNKGRSLAVFVSVVLGVVVLGVILFSYSVLVREMNASFVAARPHSLAFGMGAFDEALVDEVIQQPGVLEADARRLVSGRIQAEDGSWKPLMLYVLRDYNDININMVVTEEGSWPPGRGELLVERQALTVFGGTLGASYDLVSDAGLSGRLRLAGLTYDVVLPQAEMENVVYGYVSFETLADIGGTPGLNLLSLRIEGGSDLDRVRARAGELRGWLTRRGHEISNVDLPIPGQHPHHAITRSMFIIQEIFAGLLSLLIAILMYNLTASFLGGQVRQIGVMKAVGGSSGQIGAIYLGSMLALGLAGLVLAVPLALVAGAVYADALAAVMNFDITNGTPAWWTFLVVVAVGLGVPLLAAALPIRRAGKTPIRESLVDYGVGSTAFGASRLDRIVGSLPRVGRPLVAGFRNAFRKKGRLAFTTSILALGAALWISALNLDQTVTSFVRDLQGEKAWGVRVMLNDPERASEVTSLLYGVPGVFAVEPFVQTDATIVDPDGTEVLPLDVAAVHAETAMLRFPLLDGHWLGGAATDIVVNQYLVDRLPYLTLGSELTLRRGQQDQLFRVAGIVKTLGTQRAFIRYVPDPAGWEHANGYFVRGAEEGEAYLASLRDRVGAAMTDGGYEPRSTVSAFQGLEALLDHFVIVFNMILVLTVAVLFVGGNGIVLSMRTNLVERTREIGVMKAIGASRGLLFTMFAGEGISMGVLGWMLAAVLSFPMSYAISVGLGNVLVRAPLPMVVSPVGLLSSLPGLVLIAAASCLIPAWSIARRSVRDALLYE